jgi:hypothetical protein
MFRVKWSRAMKDRRELETVENGEPLLRSGGVFARCAQHPTQVKQLRAIQVQRRHGSST